jgi:hypothetical protein
VFVSNPDNEDENDFEDDDEGESKSQASLHSDSLRSPSIHSQAKLFSKRDSISSAGLAFYATDSKFSFKLKDFTGKKIKTFRFTSESSTISSLLSHVFEKTGYKIESNGLLKNNQGHETRVSYVDDEGDIVTLETDKDLEEAVNMSRKLGSRHLSIFIGEMPEIQSACNVSTRTNSPVQIQAIQVPQIISPLSIVVSAGILVTGAFLANRFFK